MSDSLNQLLNLCLRARRLVSGDAAVRKAIDKGNVYLLLVAGDASQRTREQFAALAREKGIPLALYGTKSDLGQVFQKPPRSVAAITDKHFARGMLRALERGEGHIMSGLKSRR
jgi:ribosomal protein L7Ae-like RNA K-turn-binding protein